MNPTNKIAEQVEVLRRILKFTAPLEESEKQALSFFIRLGEKLDVDEVGFFIYKYNTGLPEKLARNNWTGKHFQNKSKNNSYQLAQALITELTKEDTQNDRASG